MGLRFRIFDCENIVSAYGRDLTDHSLAIIIFPVETIVGTVFNTYYDPPETSCPPRDIDTHSHSTVTTNSSPHYPQRLDRTRPLPSHLTTSDPPRISLLHPHHGSQRHNRILHHFRRHNKRSSTTVSCNDPLLAHLPRHLMD